MPVGKQLGEYTGSFTSVRTCEVGGGGVIVEGSYIANVAGDISGTAVGTMEFSGEPDRGTMVDLGIGYFDSGESTPYKAQGVYWSSGNRTWQTRAAVTMGEQMLVVEGEIALAGGSFALSGTIWELT